MVHLNGLFLIFCSFFKVLFLIYSTLHSTPPHFIRFFKNKLNFLLHFGFILLRPVDKIPAGTHELILYGGSYNCQKLYKKKINCRTKALKSHCKTCVPSYHTICQKLIFSVYFAKSGILNSTSQEKTIK